MLREGGTHMCCLKYQSLFPLELKKATFSCGKQFIFCEALRKIVDLISTLNQMVRGVRLEPKNTQKLKLNMKFGARKTLSVYRLCDPEKGICLNLNFFACKLRMIVLTSKSFLIRSVT